MVSPPVWRQTLSLAFPESARNVARLLMYAGRKARPDGLVVMDDNFVDDAVAGLVAEGIRVPKDLEVVVYCNFPWPALKVMPVKRIGLDIAAFLRLCIDLIDRQRRGEPVPAATQIAAVWEEETARSLSARAPAV